MSQENVEALRAALERFAHGDWSPFFALSDDFEFVSGPEVPEAGTYRGEEAQRWLRGWRATFEGMTIEATEFLDAGDKVLVGTTGRGRLRGSAASVEERWWMVLTFRGREVVRIEMFPDRADALAAAGLRE
jgi:ketosteroid isomerase-like protein